MQKLTVINNQQYEKPITQLSKDDAISITKFITPQHHQKNPKIADQLIADFNDSNSQTDYAPTIHGIIQKLLKHDQCNIQNYAINLWHIPRNFQTGKTPAGYYVFY